MLLGGFVRFVLADVCYRVALSGFSTTLFVSCGRFSVLDCLFVLLVCLFCFSPVTVFYP